jgi:hypothetical protein
MIAKSSWFSIRKYSGWGLTPNCWQGWLYLLIAILPVIFIKNQIFIYSWMALFIVDILDVFLHLKKDERDLLHEALAERNALWIMILILIIGSFIKQTLDPVIIAALIGGTITKAVTHWHLREK